MSIYTDFEDEMIRSYPRLFKDANAQPFRGYCIPPEWFDIVRSVAVQLESELTEAEQLSFYFSDIKEKYGQISFHWGVGYDADSKVEKIIDWAEMQTL